MSHLHHGTYWTTIIQQSTIVFKKMAVSLPLPFRVLFFLTGVALNRIRGVEIFHSRATVNTSWTTAIYGGRGSIIAMIIV